MSKKKDKQSRKRKSKGTHEMGGISVRFMDFLVQYRLPLSLSILTIITIVAFYVRYLPALKFGIELDANDPWIAYWIAKYFNEHGLLAFDGLRNVKEFWWPHGRDFMSTEYIGVSWFAAATYPIAKLFGLSLKEWIALMPVFAGTLAVVFSFILVYKLTKSMLGGLVSAILFAVLPGAITRTIVGFVEKTGIAIPQLILFILFLYMMFQEKNYRRSLVYGALAGIIGGSIGWVWGGVHIVTLLFALVLVIVPLFGMKNEFYKLKPVVVGVLFYALIAGAYPKVGFEYFVYKIGAGLILALIFYYLGFKLLKQGYTVEHYVYILAVVLLIGGVAVFSGYLPIGGRILAAIGVKETASPLVTSVQENQPANLKYIINQYGIALMLALIGLFYQLYQFISNKKGDPVKLSIFLTSLALFYGNLNLSYLTQMSSTFAVIAAGIFIGDIMSLGFTSKGGSLGVLGLKKSSKTIDPLPAIIAGTLVVIVLAGSLLQFEDSLNMAKLHAAQIDTSGMSPFVINGTVIVPINDAWKNALEYINQSTPRDALIVTWWDYGYWVTVNTGRKTLADGATLNETQIRLLARILTGTEGEASSLLKMIGAKPNETYILAYEVFYFFRNNDTLIVLPAYNMPSSDMEQAIYKDRGYYIISHGQADWAKSFQMLRIGRRVNPEPGLTPFDTNYSSIYNAWKNFPGLIGMPIDVVDKVRNTLIYKLMIDGAYSLTSYREGCNDPLMWNITNVQFMIRAMGTSLTGQSFVTIPKPAILQDFVPEKIFVGCPYITTDHTQGTGVMIILYKWTG